MKRGSEGFTLIELAITMVITLVLVGLVAPTIVAATDASDYSEGINGGIALAREGLQSLQAQVESATEICLPSGSNALYSGSATVTAGWALRVLTLANGKTQWVQWYLTGGVLEEQVWPTAWTTGQAVPGWVPVAQKFTNNSAPFALPNVPAGNGSPQSLTVDLWVNQGVGNKVQSIELQSGISAFSTPYSVSSNWTCAAGTTGTEGWNA